MFPISEFISVRLFNSYWLSGAAPSSSLLPSTAGILLSRIPQMPKCDCELVHISRKRYPMRHAVLLKIVNRHESAANYRVHRCTLPPIKIAAVCCIRATLCLPCARRRLARCALRASGHRANGGATESARRRDTLRQINAPTGCRRKFI